ncbi:hypothetical protein HDU85_002945 [Gaertneriomyces sp. JEL0708]|nr:calmodulin variant 1 [Gaertneriomyces semiglobifer]KAJ3189317.1 hypothetical protein HDU85_002945 [Gaertneriomyces sp. JEL0708]
MGDQVKLSESQIAELQEAFSLFDDDSDGIITCAQLGSVMRAIGQCPTEKELNEIAKQKGSSGVDFPEFLALASRRMAGNIDFDKEIREAFRIFDPENTGKLSPAELRHVLTTVGEKLSAEEVEDLVRECGLKDGAIALDDFIRVMSAK